MLGNGVVPFFVHDFEAFNVNVGDSHAVALKNVGNSTVHQVVVPFVEEFSPGPNVVVVVVVASRLSRVPVAG